jgi:hypothetical protein
MTDTEKFPPEKNLPAGYVPPKTWTWEPGNGGAFASTNRPVAGPTHEKDLPVGKHPLQLYSLGTPNGVKVTIMLEELLAVGHSGAEYDAWLIRIGDGDQFGSGFDNSEQYLKRAAACGRFQTPLLYPRCHPLTLPHEKDRFHDRHREILAREEPARRLCPAENLDLGTRQWRRLRQHQPAGGRSHA